MDHNRTQSTYMYYEPEMNVRSAIGFLIAGAVNVLWQTNWDPDDPNSLPSCCVTCCGPCAALAYFRDHNPEMADVAVQEIMTSPTDRYSWQDPVTQNIRWDKINEMWERDQCPNVETHELAVMTLPS